MIPAQVEIIESGSFAHLRGLEEVTIEEGSMLRELGDLRVMTWGACERAALSNFVSGGL
jgi:hypothetical protein